MIARTLRILAGALVAVSGSQIAQAQQENITDEDVANVPILSSLMKAPDIRLLTQESDPSVRKANAIVNGDVVTDTDVEQRLNLVLAANPTPVEDAEKRRLRMQIMRNLIDEKLQIQESRDNDIIIAPQELEQAYRRVAGNFNMEPQQFEEYLAERDTSHMAIQQQIHAELAWQRLLRRRVQPFVNVGDDEVEALIARLEASKGTDEYRIGELVFFTSPETAADTMADAQRIVEQLQQGASFVAYARQYSQSSTATLGGELGWVKLEQLSPELQPIISQLQEGQITRPVQLPGRIVILALIDKRQILTADENDALLSLKQLNVRLPADISQEQAEALARRIQTEVAGMGGCGGMEAVAERLGGEVTVNDQIRLGDLPPQLKGIMTQLQTGQSTPPFGSAEEGIKVLTMCGREQGQAVAAPDFDNMFAQLEEERVNMMARRYLRDLRRDAIIDYR
ncbi:peptidylprolyl isomerase [Pacificimonas sp. WHA3]|uniref:Peptidylprolyl isomerase n=1 Tax=Pacificimonas pallii TaxID=2827236 RepID=A0ABS6SFD6_9SPHN|nr:peptidylprolyl isomerase [Pacificimonas pallii]MBV7257046.1 peptidylprolyl isomerase [Pacificimonas pallii]